MRSAALLLFLVPLLLNGQSILGRWATIDDETGKKRSLVEITERAGKFYGRIIEVFRDPGEGQELICTKCAPDDDRFGKKVIGMEILRDLVKDPSTGSEQAEWVDGTILDPKTGTVYDCKLWIEDGNLKVRGYVAFFYRTQTWVREQSKY